MSLIVKAGKMGKRVLKKFLPEEKHHVSYTRRIERVHTKERVVAMTFDDGPMDLPSSPDKFGGRALTDLLLDTLQEYHALGTFDVVGDTSENYPDLAGKSGQADWGGVRYDHYPDINQTAGEGWSTTTGWSAGFCTRGTRSPTTGTAMSSLGKSPLSTASGTISTGWTPWWLTSPGCTPFSRRPTAIP